MYIIISFRIDGNWNVKKAIGIKAKQLRFFVHIFAVRA